MTEEKEGQINVRKPKTEIRIPEKEFLLVCKAIEGEEGFICIKKQKEASDDK